MLVPQTIFPQGRVVAQLAERWIPMPKVVVRIQSSAKKISEHLLLTVERGRELAILNNIYIKDTLAPPQVGLCWESAKEISAF